MKANEIRQQFLDFFESKLHKIVPSAPMVVKDDPTLMFTNAGMNQFKDLFLGNSPITAPRIADSQKCLRVSGKHNDLEEVGHDTYHHTMFEMLGNWSFGDYFKKEAIEWAWELLTKVYKLPVDRLYATIFEGDSSEDLARDTEALDLWRQFLPEHRILNGNKKDNFWEMGDTGPCGPCSEIHIDLRSEAERAKTPGEALVNNDHPQVVEIWNLVFIQFNRKADSSLESLPAKHVDTGMGFERLCMAIQGKQSNYDTDVFTPLIGRIAELSNLKYGTDTKQDIAMRVIADHVRTISFSIADGQLPSNNKAGYVIRRILRRGIRYAYAALGQEEPFINKLVPTLVATMGDAYPEIKAQQELIEKVIHEEEAAFLRTIANGTRLLDELVSKAREEGENTISGKDAFVLYDTFGFPLDLTQLILRENKFSVSQAEFDAEMEKQKARSRDAAATESADWQIIRESESTSFIGYDHTEAMVRIMRYRKQTQKKKEYYQLVFDQTPFYAESGGQVGDTGYIEYNGQRLEIFDTQKENNLPVHLVAKLPAELDVAFRAVVNAERRQATRANHSATHLLQEALREVLGTHIEQKGSYVSPERLRFDFSHFQKMTDEEIARAEQLVNAKIRQAIALDEHRNLPIDEAKQMGALMFFGEKYGDHVRVIRFDSSIELCGGTHVSNTAQIGSVKIVSETAIAAGIRRIEAITAETADQWSQEHIAELKQIKALLKSPKDTVAQVENLLAENQKLQKELEQMKRQQALALAKDLEALIEENNGIRILAREIALESAQQAKDLAFALKAKFDNLYLVLGANINGKANLTIAISDKLADERKLDAGKIVREAAKEVQGGGGGQAVFATAGGKLPERMQHAIDKALSFVK